MCLLRLPSGSTKNHWFSCVCHPDKARITTKSIGFIAFAIQICRHNKENNGFIASVIRITKKNIGFNPFAIRICRNNKEKLWFYNVCHGNHKKALNCFLRLHPNKPEYKKMLWFDCVCYPSKPEPTQQNYGFNVFAIRINRNSNKSMRVIPFAIGINKNNYGLIAFACE